MRGKRRLLPLLLAGLLLSGCGAGTEPNAASLGASASPPPRGIRFRRDGGRWYAMLGRELVDITDRLPEDAEPEGLRCGDCIHFVPADGAVAVMADAWLAGEGLPPTVCYAVDVQAEFTCRDGMFTVQAFHLNVLKD